MNIWRSETPHDTKYSMLFFISTGKAQNSVENISVSGKSIWLCSSANVLTWIYDTKIGWDKLMCY